MARESAREVAIQDATSTPIYQDQRQIVRQLGAHLAECFIAQGDGAGGAGFEVTNVPFQPAVIEAINEGGATPTVSKFVYATSGTVGVAVAAAAADGTANAPTLTKVGNGDWTVSLPTALAPDTETVTLIMWGARDVGGSL